MKTNGQPTLGEGFIFRAATIADLEEVVELLNDYWQRSFGMHLHTTGEIGSILTLPGFDMETGTRVIHSAIWRMVGFVLVWDLASPPLHPDVEGCVHSCFEGQGIGTYLLKWAEERARLAINRVPDSTGVAMHLIAPVGHEPTKRLL